MMRVPECCVPGCGGGREHVCAQHAGESLCAAHFSLASARSRRLWQSAAMRLAGLQRSWDDERVFEAIVVRGRHLAFCALLETAHDHADRAWRRLRLEVLAATGEFAPWSPEIAAISDRPEHRPDARSGSLDGGRRISPATQD
jgi:hypothetical protein